MPEEDSGSAYDDQQPVDSLPQDELVEDERAEPVTRPTDAVEPAVELAEMPTVLQSLFGDRTPKSCLVRRDTRGDSIVDTVAGRASVLGFENPELFAAIHSAAETYLGDGSAFGDGSFAESDESVAEWMADLFASIPGEMTGCFLAPSADMAVERAIMLARRYRSPRAFRTVALVGSDHGRTLLCRTASGRPELQEDLGPLVAGFSHVPPGDLDALDVAVDEQTACVLISPNLWSRGGEVLDAAYLKEVQRLCNQRDVLLAVDESQVVFGATGQPLAICSIADVRPDLVVLSSGLFGGLPGGITLASRRVTGGEDRCEIGFPLLAAVLSTTMRSIRQQGLLASVSDSAESLAIELAERVSAFEFVRDVHALGLSIGLETDLSSTTLVQTAASRGVRLEAAGETAIRIQPPLALNDEDRRILIAAIEETFSSIQLSAADLSV